MSPLSNEQLQSPLSERELHAAVWYVAHRAALRRIFTLALAVVNLGIISGLAIGIVRLVFTPSLSGLERDFVDAPIAYASFRDVFEPQGLVVRRITAVPYEQNLHLVADIVNPNNGWYAERAEIQFITPNRVLPPVAVSFLPGEQRIVPMFRVEGARRSDHISVSIGTIAWRRIRGSVEASPFVVDTPAVDEIPVGTNAIATRVRSRLHNSAPRGFWNVRVMVVLRRGEQILGVVESTLERVKSGESRPFEVRFLTRFPQGTQADITPLWNPFDEDNILPLELDI